MGKYVCCENCQLPEIAMNIKKGMIVGRCLACGWAGNLDNNHKLAAFILNNPPDESGHGIIMPTGGEGKGDKKSRREEKARKQAEAKNRGEDDEDEDDEDASVDDEDEAKEEKKKKKKKDEAEDDDDDEEKKEKKAKKEKKDRKEKKDKKEKKKANNDSDESDKEDEDKSSDEDNNKNKASKKDGDDLEHDDQELKDIIKKVEAFFREKNGKPSVDDLFDNVRTQQLAQGFNAKVRLYVVLEAVCGTAMDAKAITQQKKYVSKFISNAK